MPSMRKGPAPRSTRVKPAHYRGRYHVDARRVRRDAYADPATRCRRCGLTLAEFRARHPGRNWRWAAGHVVDGQPGGRLVAEHGYCNSSAGAAMGNRRRARTPRQRRTELTW